MATGQAEYFFTESALRPYVGVEAGLYSATAKFEIKVPSQDPVSESATVNSFGVAPKVGLQYAITPAIGVNLDAGYHVVFNDGETGKLLVLGAGVFFTFGQK